MVGPNGSGKSSIVCALALGLAGGTNVLGRATRAHEFIRHGADKAELEIELSSGDAKKRNEDKSLSLSLSLSLSYTFSCPANTVIWRQITKNDDNKGGGSKWKLNGKTATQEKVKEVIALLNVQVDNLCQFLPQDKVSSFSSLDGCDLLRTTERALERADSQPEKMHLQLIALKRDLSAMERSAAALKEQVAALETQQAGAARDVLRFKERERIRDEVVWLKKKLPWMKFESLRQKAKDLQDECKQFEADLDELKEKLKPFEERISDAHAAAAEAVLAVKPLLSAVSDAKQAAEAWRDKYEKLAEDCTKLKEKRNRLAMEVAQREAKVKRCEQAVTVAEAQLAEFEASVPALAKRHSEAQAAAERADQTLGHVGQKLMSARATRRNLVNDVTQKQSELNDITNRQKQRLGALSQMREAEDTIKAYHFIHNPANKALFEKPVYGPICMEVELVDASKVVEVESAIPGQNWQAFVCQSESDRAALRQRFNVNVIVVLEKATERPRKFDDATKARLGIVKWLDEALTTNDPVILQALDSATAIRNIALCRDDADPEAVSAADVGYFFIKNQQFTAKRSNYGQRNVTTKTRDISSYRARLLQFSGNGDAEKALRGDIDMLSAEIGKIDEQLRAAEDEERRAKQLVDSVRAANAAVQHNRGEIERAKRNVRKAQELLLEAKESAAGNVDELRGRCTQQIAELNKQRVKAVRVWAEAVETLVTAQRTFEAADLRREALQARLHAAKQTSKNLRNELTELEARAVVKRAEYEESKKRTKEAKRVAEELCPIDNDVRDRFAALPDTEELVQGQIDGKEARMMSLQTSSGVIREFEERAARLQLLQPQLAEAEAQCAERVAELQRLHDKWLPIVQNIASRLNVSFSAFMKELGCAGEVALEPDADYQKYELQIRVTFRNNEALQKLSANVQSGGERSVSTMLFLISMQDLADCPFRLVDEINQGMDPRNERAIFSLVVRAATRRSTFSSRRSCCPTSTTTRRRRFCRSSTGRT